MLERKKKQAAQSGSQIAMADREYKRFSDFIHSECGIKLPPSKKTMVEARLQKRLRSLEMAEFREYCDYVFSSKGLDEELIHLIDVITTNTTEFFREPRHFEILNKIVLPKWAAEHQNGRALRFWSAGCSTGEEPYTLAMVFSEFAARNSGFRFSILATDISTNVLQRAAQGIYSEDKSSGINYELKKKYLMRSKDRSRKEVRFAPEIRRCIKFSRLNFMHDFKFKDSMDIIFCRNVLIYFERDTQEQLIRKFCNNLIKGGHLFIGHSESLTGMDLPLSQLAPTVYTRV